MVKKIIAILLMLCLSLTFLIACDDKNEPETEPVADGGGAAPLPPVVKPYVYKGTLPAVQINLSDGRFIRLELYPEYAPKTVENFLKLVEEDYYDNLVFHRIIDCFMIQAGLYKYTAENSYTEAPRTDSIEGEFKQNGFEDNTIKHVAGVISMARTSSDMNSASAQFFIVSATSASNTNSLDEKYAAFGKTLDEISLQTVVSLSKVPTGVLEISSAETHENFPIEPIIITSVERLDKVSE